VGLQSDVQAPKPHSLLPSSLYTKLWRKIETEAGYVDDGRTCIINDTVTESFNGQRVENRRSKQVKTHSKKMKEVRETVELAARAKSAVKGHRTRASPEDIHACEDRKEVNGACKKITE
jgi:hypothetical protein